MAADAPTASPFSDDVLAERAVLSVIDDIVAAGGRQLYDSYLRTKEVDFAARAAWTEIAQAVTAAFLPLPAAAPPSRTPQLWAEAVEASPAPVDTWGRAMIPVRPPPRPASRDPAAGGTTHRSQATGSGAAGSRRRARGGPPGRSRSSSLRPDSRDGAQVAAPGATPKGAKPAPDGVSPARLRPATNRSSAEGAAAAPAPAPESAPSPGAAGAPEARGAAGRLPGAGRSGAGAAANAVSLRPINPESLPWPTQVDAVVVDPAAEAAEEEARAAASRPRRAGAPRPEAQTRRTTKRGQSSPGKRDPSAQALSPFFSPSETAQPPLAPRLQLAPGVTLVEGDSELKGPEASEDPGRMTLSQYKEHQRKLLEQAQHRIGEPVPAGAGANAARTLRDLQGTQLGRSPARVVG